MIAALAIAVRFVLYLDLMLLFGVPAFALYNRAALAEVASALPARTVMLAAGAFGIALSGMSVALMAASMSGLDLATVGRGEIVAVLTETAFGTAILVRLVALVLALLLVLRAPDERSGMMYALPVAAAALATLAWSGHAAMSDSLVARIHLGADILHLWAAGVWIGALASLLMLIGLFGGLSGARVKLIHHVLAAFALPGSVLVATLMLTGAINSWVLVGPAHLFELPGSLYGQIFLLKLVLFTAMLGLASYNRFRLTPALNSAIEDGSTSGTALRRSLGFETVLGWAILALVAWIGTLAPPASLP